MKVDVSKEWCKNAAKREDGHDVSAGILGGEVPTELDYIQGLWCDEKDKNRELCLALKAVYALAGEVNGVKEIVEEALETHGSE